MTPEELEDEMLKYIPATEYSCGRSEARSCARIAIAYAETKVKEISFSSALSDSLPKSEEELKEKMILFCQYMKTMRHVYSDEIDTDLEESMFYSTEYDEWRKLGNVR